VASVFTGRMAFLPPNQQRQSTEGTVREYVFYVFFQISKKRDFFVFRNDVSKSHKKSLAKVQSPILRNDFTYFAQ